MCLFKPWLTCCCKSDIISLLALRSSSSFYDKYTIIINTKVNLWYSSHNNIYTHKISHTWFRSLNFAIFLCWKYSSFLSMRWCCKLTFSFNLKWRSSFSFSITISQALNMTAACWGKKPYDSLRSQRMKEYTFIISSADTRKVTWKWTGCGILNQVAHHYGKETINR